MKLFIILLILIVAVCNLINGEDFSIDSQNGEIVKYRQKRYFSLYI